jgi:hypothetical protein
MDIGMVGSFCQCKKSHWTKRISATNLSSFVRGEKFDKHLLEATISDVVSVVIKRHFLPRHPNLDVSELFSLGYCKAFAKLKERWINPKCDLVVIVYSTARNEIGNYLRKLRRERLTDPEDFDFVRRENDEGEDIDIMEDLSICYGEVSERLGELGICTCKVEAFFPKESKGNNQHERHQRKTGFDWFSIKSALIRTVACRGEGF